MLHPTLARALADAHIEDLQRAATRSHAMHVARSVAHEPRSQGPPIAGHRSAPALLRKFRAARPSA
jgi:hypothetical protein